MDKRIRTFNSVFIIFIFSLINFVFSIALQLFLAYLFGTSIEMDAYVVAMTLPMIIGSLLLSFEVVFVPVFKNYSLVTSEDKLNNLISTVFNLLVLILALISVIGLLFAPKLASILAPGFSLQSKELFQILFRIMMPSVIFSGLAAFLISVYHFREKFLLPVLAPSVNILVIIIITLLFNSVIGIKSLAFGVLLGSIAQLFLLFPGLLHKKQYSFLLDIRQTELAKISKKLLYLTVGGIFEGSILIVEKFLASSFPKGSISALSYAGKIISLVVILPTAAIPTVLLPQLSTFYTLNDMNKLKDSLSKGIRMSFLFVLPIAALLFTFRVPLIKLLFQRGAFDVAATNNTSIALVCYLGIFIATGIGKLITIGFLAMHEVVTLLLLMIADFFLYICIAPFLSKLFLFKGLASAFSLANILGLFLLFYILRKRLSGIVGLDLLKSFLKIFFSSLIMGAISFFVFKGLPDFTLSGGNFTLVIRMGIAIFAGFLAFNIACFALRVDEIRLAYELISFRIKVFKKDRSI